jgi:hypothetical protein
MTSSTREGSTRSVSTVRIIVHSALCADARDRANATTRTAGAGLLLDEERRPVPQAEGIEVRPMENFP